LPIQRHATGIRATQACQNAQKRGLTTAIGTK
jgi:hypothetical protein